jgi:hypothetical protein
MPFFLKKTVARYIKGYRILEPDALKGASPVLRREGRSNPPDLFDVSRKTIGFSKIAKCLVNQMKLYCTHLNFCRGHRGLKYKDERGVGCKNTPARQAGITQSNWNLKELLSFRRFKTPI